MSKKTKTSSAGSMLIQSLPSLLKPKGSSKKKAAKETAASSGGSAGVTATTTTTTSGASGKTKERREKESSSSGNKSRESSSKAKKSSSSKHHRHHHHNDNHVVVNGNATIGHAPSSAQTAGAPVDIRGRPIVRKKWRPLSYAEPGSHKGRSSSVGSAVLQGSCFGGNSNHSSSSNNNKSHNGNNKSKISNNNDNNILINNNNNNNNNNNSFHDIDYMNETFDPRIITRLEADLFTMDQHYSKMYNGHSVRELEARLCQLKLQQLARRNSVDFAISCVEPHPMCYVEEGVGQDRLGIYIKSVVPGGSADMDGRLQDGDQLLTVDGQSLVGITQEKAAEYLVRTGPVVTLEVAKQAAIYQGLATMLSQPSPVMSRDSEVSRLDSAFCEISAASSLGNIDGDGDGVGSSGTMNGIASLGGVGTLWGTSTMRASQSDSSLARWKSFETLNRRGLSDTALGLSRIVGTSRLLKFLQTPLYDSDSRSTSSTPTPTGGPQARRMSERDLPSKVMREAQLLQSQQQQQHGGQGTHPVDMESAPHHSAILQPRIHSSKSVPSLNSERDHHVGSIPMSNSIVGPGMLSPGVMNNSVPSAAMIRSAGGYPMGHQDSGGGGLRGYPPVNYPSMTMQPKTSLHHYPAPSDPHRSRSIQSLATDPGLNRADIGAKSTPSLHQGGGEDERYYQNVGFYPPPPPPPNATTNPAANMPLRTYIPYSSSAGNLQSSSSPHLTPTAAGGSTQGQFRPMPGGSYRGPPPNLIQANWQQQQQRQQLQQQQQQQQMNLQMGHHQRDLMRQEAKMLEMQDELRRREERAALMMTKAQQHQNRYAPRFTYTPTPPMIQQQQLLQQQQQHRMSGSGPPTVPTKPNRPDSLLDNGGGPGRPPLPDEYKFSSGEPPRGAFTFNNGMMNKQLGGNPWENAEKERDLQRRKEMARFWRDQQIQDLESMPTRNPAQDEQLRTLRLEREFQRRAEENRREDDGEGNEEEEEEDERKAMVRRVQEDLERTRISGAHLPATNGNRLDPMEEERARKMEEIRRKKMELEAAQAAEERLVREATKRREEELRRQQSQILQQSNNQHHQMMNQQQQQQQQMHIQQSYSSSSYRTSYSSSSKISPDQHQPQQTSPNAGGVSGGLTSPSRTHAPPLPTSPPPNTTRPTTITNNGNGFSGNSVDTPEKSPVTPPQTSPRPKSDKKTVSFNETVATNEPPESDVDSPPAEKVREDPNRFISEAQALLSSPRSPDGTGVGSSLNTPGVIGAQEVYRDPRWRRLQEQQQKQQAANAPKPEKLTFKEKMKMFAMESGEDATPKDKVKVSKAQREIETFPTPTK